MSDRIKDDFDAIHADAACRERTRDALAAYTAAHQKPVHRRKPIMALCGCLAAVLCSGYAFFTPVSAISIDVNPSLELGVNRFDRVVSVEGFNADGTALAQSLDLRFARYADAVNTLLASDTLTPYLTQDDSISITVLGSNEAKSEEMLVQLEGCAQGEQANVSCHAGSRAEVDAAHEAGLSFGKYQAFLELQTLDPSITTEDVQGWTMRQIRDHILACTDGDRQTTAGNGQGQPSGNGQGQPGGGGQGHGMHNGHGAAQHE